MVVWLEVVRTILGLLILLALSTLFGLFRKTKMIEELKIITFGFALYTLQAAIGAYQSMGNAVPTVWYSLEIDEFLEASMYVVFAVAVVRLKKVFDTLKVEQKLFKVLKDVFG